MRWRSCAISAATRAWCAGRRPSRCPEPRAAAMRRFVQSLTDASQIDPSVPQGVRDALAGFPDRYNIAIRGQAAIVFTQDGRWKVAPMSWGLVPSWEKEPSTRYSTQTARLERARDSRLYRSAWANRRC